MQLADYRNVVQLLSFVVLTYGGRFGLRLGHFLPCLSCPYSGMCAGHCYLMVLQNSFWGLEMPLAALFSYRGLEMLAMFAGFLVLTLLLGRLWCGWICPFGTLQDWITAVRGRLNIRESRWATVLTVRLQWIKYLLLGLLLILPLMIANLGLHDDFSLPFCQICPAKPIMPLFTGKTEYFSIDLTNGITTVMSALSMFLTAMVVVGMFFKDRFFCIFCPMLALIGIFDRFGALHLLKKIPRCSGCGGCRRNCPMDIQAVHAELTVEKIHTEECIGCMRCAEACPGDGTLTFKWFRLTLFSSSFAAVVRKLSGRRKP